MAGWPRFLRMPSRAAFNFGRSLTYSNLLAKTEPQFLQNHTGRLTRLTQYMRVPIAGLTTAALRCRHMLAQARRVVL